jgi:hypothetical protein
VKGACLALDEKNGKFSTEKERHPVTFDELPPGKRAVLLSFPRRVKKEVQWKYRDDGTIVLRYRKKLTSPERVMHKVVGGPMFIKVPLDDKCSFIWELCDGKHNVVEICELVYDRFKEDAEPVAERVLKYLEILLRRNLIYLENKKSSAKRHEKQ